MALRLNFLAWLSIAALLGTVGFTVMGAVTGGSPKVSAAPLTGQDDNTGQGDSDDNQEDEPDNEGVVVTTPTTTATRTPGPTATATPVPSAAEPVVVPQPVVAGPCAFILGFRALRDMIPEVVGDCLSNEMHNPANGDGLQFTRGGLMVWRKADNWTAFTNGSTTWLNGPCGLQTRPNPGPFYSWEGRVGAPCTALHDTGAMLEPS